MRTGDREREGGEGAETLAGVGVGGEAVSGDWTETALSEVGVSEQAKGWSGPRIKCPHCERSDRVGRIRMIEECIDQDTGMVVRHEPEWTILYECGWCSEHWKHIGDLA